MHQKIFILLMYIFERYLSGKRSCWRGVSFWKKVLPKIVSKKILNIYANELCKGDGLYIAYNVDLLSTKEKIDSFFDGCSLDNKAYLLSVLEAFRLARKKSNDELFPYPSFDLIDKDINKLMTLDTYAYKPGFDSYYHPDDRLAASFNW